MNAAEEARARDRATIARARAQWASDKLEIDDDAVVSRGDNPDDPGAFVAAWVWVSEKEES